MRKNTMYGLFYNSYDYYKWERLVCVSKTKKKLKEYYKTLEPTHPLLTPQESEDIDLAKIEQNHYVILKITQV